MTALTSAEAAFRLLCEARTFVVVDVETCPAADGDHVVSVAGCHRPSRPLPARRPPVEVPATHLSAHLVTLPEEPTSAARCWPTEPPMPATPSPDRSRRSAAARPPGPTPAATWSTGTGPAWLTWPTLAVRRRLVQRR